MADREIEKNRKIVVKDFYGPGEHIYEDDLGWSMNEKREAGSLVSKKIFDFEVVEVGLNLGFYYVDDDTFYGIHTEQYPIECKILPRDRTKKYIGWQCKVNTHDDGIVIASFDDEHDIWDNLRINGKSLEEVIARSYIMALN